MDEMITLPHSCTDLRDADGSEANLRGARLTESKLCQDQRAVPACAGTDLDDERFEDTSGRGAP
jgi:uncharacterized protein YjbI with pentapeptide repeats